MKLIDALRIAAGNPGPDQAPAARFFLGCGFTPLHLASFLKAHLAEALPGRHIALDPGLYGDLAGSLERLDAGGLSGAAVVVEWPDLDARLGLRSLGGWAPSRLAGILESAEAAAGRLAAALERTAGSVPVALCLPTLAPPPLGITAGTQAGEWEIRLEGVAQRLAERAAAHPRIGVAHPRRLDALSPPAGRRHARSDLASGFPYQTAHAEAVARMLAALLAPAAPKKGLITDLDGTLWSGILGEDGAEGLRWDLEGNAQVHGLYQQLLEALAERGVLLAVASKNGAEAAAAALAGGGLSVDGKRFFPVEANWGPKSASVGRILEAWNLAADSVVFVDDTPLELAEVSAAWPALECLHFPAADPDRALELLETLRDRFGKPSLSAEDALRAASVAGAARWRTEAAAAGSVETLLSSLEAGIDFRLAADPGDERALELVNKTNQFNLNGRREGEAEWRRRLLAPEAVLLTAAYRDKFGPAGRIAVAQGRREGAVLRLEAWVMSCRVFSRRIEHAMLRYLFDKLGVETIRFDFAATARNGPLQELLEGLAAGPPDCTLPRERFFSRCPALYHTVREILE